MSDLAPDEYEASLTELVHLHQRYLGRMMVRAKCAPQFMRLVHQLAPDSPILGYETRCPCGTQYCRITPDGKLTPCPYLPAAAGDLRASSFADVWRSSSLFSELRTASLGGRCGKCEYRGICGGCRARAFAMDDDYLGEDPSCTYEPSGTVPLVTHARPVTYGMRSDRSLPWSPEAEARVSRIPSFVRGVVVKRVEDFARQRGVECVTLDLMSEVRRAMPVDFSKRRPFFLGEE